MKARWPFIVCGFLAAFVAFVSVQSLRPAQSGPGNAVTISLLGYTNRPGSSMAIIQVTNHIATTFTCFVGPRMNEAGRGGRRLAGDFEAYPGMGVLRPRGAFTFAVPIVHDTNRWHVSVELQPLRAAQPAWQMQIAAALRRLGFHGFGHENYQLTSPAF
jgi:hypothetical protein